MLMYYDIRIEPKEHWEWWKIQQIIEEAFKPYGGLSAEGVEFIGCD